MAVSPPSRNEPAEHFVQFCLAEEREHSRRCSIYCAKALALTRLAYRAAAHVPLPKITMSNSARRRVSRLNSTVTPASQRQPRSSVGAGYRSGVLTCQTLKLPEKRFFPGACGWPPDRKSKREPAPYIGVVLINPTARRRQRPRELGSFAGAIAENRPFFPLGQ